MGTPHRDSATPRLTAEVEGAIFEENDIYDKLFIF